MLQPVPPIHSSGLQPSYLHFTTPQPLCCQDFAYNPFLFIDLAGTPSTRPNQFIDLRENAIFFQE